MTNLEITVHVNLGITPELTALVNAILHKVSQPVVAASLEPAPKAAPAPVEEKPASETEAEPEVAPAEDEKPKELTEEDEKPKELTEEDVRAAMHRTRTRIEGEDYKENTDGEKYQKYHKQLTASFKNISALLGADKPSALPADKRESFIKQCDELEIGDDGTITTKCPF